MARTRGVPGTTILPPEEADGCDGNKLQFGVIANGHGHISVDYRGDFDNTFEACERRNVSYRTGFPSTWDTEDG